MQLTVRDVAGLLEVSEKTVYRWIEDGKLPGYRISGQYRFNRAELLGWATANKINISPEIFHEREAGAAVLPSLAESLHSGGIHYRVAGRDSSSCLRSVVELFRLPDEVDREFLLQVLVARERLESTAIGRGIAVPHLRNPIVLHLPRPMISLCFLESPVDWGALDGEPVTLLFTLISPTVKAHLHLLSRLTFALRDVNFATLIRKQAGRDEILEGVRQVSSRLVTPVRLESTPK